MEEVKSWVQNGEWKKGIRVSVHPSVNEKEFYRQYMANTSVWQKVFHFLKETEQDVPEVGKYEIEGDKAFAMVSEYQTKEAENAKWESHKNYIDLQYVILGKETMGLTSLGKAKDEGAYNEEKDLIFYGESEGEYFEANPTVFFLFFPEDVHRPSIKIDQPTTVRKLVVKVRVAD